MAKKKSWLTGSAVGNMSNRSNINALTGSAVGSLGGNNGGGRLSSSGKGIWAITGSALGHLMNNQSNEEVDPIAQKVKDYADLLNKYGFGPGGSGSSSSSSGGGYVAPNRIDIQPMIDAFTNAANAQKNTLQTTANQQRSDLLNSIKRFQEQTARSQEIQRDAFNSSRADLEEAAFQADRANRISAAARGIGGSGLQQLSQLQTLMEQNSSISDLAKENTNVQTELAKNLANYEDETNTAIQNLMANLANSLTQIDADLGNQIANLRYQEDTRYEQARQAAMENAMNRAQSARSSAASARNSYNQALLEYELGLREQYAQDNSVNELIRNLESDFSDKISTITDTSTLEDTLAAYKNDMYTLAKDNLISNDVYSSGIANLNSAYSNRLNSLNKNNNNNSFLSDIWKLMSTPEYWLW